MYYCALHPLTKTIVKIPDAFEFKVGDSSVYICKKCASAIQKDNYEVVNVLDEYNRKFGYLETHVLLRVPRRD